MSRDFECSRADFADAANYNATVGVRGRCAVIQNYLMSGVKKLVFGIPRSRTMQFKVPPGSLSWLTALWILLGAFVSYSSFRDGDPIYAWGGLIFCIAGILVWLDVREIAWPLMIWFGVVIACGFLLLAIKGVTFRPIWGIAMAGLMIYDLNKWRVSD